MLCQSRPQALHAEAHSETSTVSATTHRLEMPFSHSQIRTGTSDVYSKNPVRNEEYIQTNYADSFKDLSENDRHVFLIAPHRFVSLIHSFKSSRAGASGSNHISVFGRS